MLCGLMELARVVATRAGTLVEAPVVNALLKQIEYVCKVGS